MRDYALVYINGTRREVRGSQLFLSLSDYLRDELGLTGTKVVCSEGDCGACTVLKAFPIQEKFEFQSINSCITFMYLLDCSHIVTVEGLKENDELGEIQHKMLENNGSQCGFCTPGFVMALAALFEEKDKVEERHIKNALTGNLCRCTGYAPIIDAGLSVNPKKVKSLKKRYLTRECQVDLKEIKGVPLSAEMPGVQFYSPTSIKEAGEWRKKNSPAKIMASATDLGVLVNKERWEPTQILSLNLIDELYQISSTEESVKLGARVSLSELGNFLEDKIPELSRLLHIFASPQIKNSGTLVGNIANASPIGDTLPFLLAIGAQLEIQGPTEIRIVDINKFYKGYKDLDLEENEIITNVYLPIPQEGQIQKVYKVSKRKDLDISSVNGCFTLNLDQDQQIKEIRIALGGVAATPIRLTEMEEFLQGKSFSKEVIEEAAEKMADSISPLSDVRGTSNYRKLLSKNLLKKFYFDVQKEMQR